MLYTLYDVKVISVVDPETFLATPLWAKLEMGICHCPLQILQGPQMQPSYKQPHYVP